MLHEPATLWGTAESGAGAATLRRDSDPAVDQCLGTLITHADDWVECTEPACDDLHLARHAWAVACVSEWDACPCRADDA